jgi:hypothetical protein
MFGFNYYFDQTHLLAPRIFCTDVVLLGKFLGIVLADGGEGVPIIKKKLAIQYTVNNTINNMQ